MAFADMAEMNHAETNQFGLRPTHFERDILAGLTLKQKALPSQYFYDARGSELFEQITALPEYYPTRTEVAILTACAAEIAQTTQPNTVLVEFGSGSSVKTDILLAASAAIAHYVPIDVSVSALEQARARLATAFPRLHVEPVVADFTGIIGLPADVLGRPKLGFFPGSTIGNFGHEAAVSLLARFRHLLGRGSRLIVGADLRKAIDILLPAYNDAAGVTAEFNRNLLTRINRELAGTFDVEQFSHSATYDAATGQINMWLTSLTPQSVLVAGHRFSFAQGERIHTEISQKYAVSELQDLAQRAGWTAHAVWKDERALFSVHEFVSP